METNTLQSRLIWNSIGTLDLIPPDPPLNVLVIASAFLSMVFGTITDFPWISSFIKNWNRGLVKIGLVKTGRARQCLNLLSPLNGDTLRLFHLKGSSQPMSGSNPKPWVSQHDMSNSNIMLTNSGRPSLRQETMSSWLI
ncbi:hypothetical protein LOTGIDRAFT_157917 [Lottia gigantea]|uniref:Uncharacterized protein n=1 Tax=Lottia gigantea TaxID=225164 RepID=V4AZQ3_LOTGI|nr:hypothetical protein LOTGIDRAFT_157917 [Lottia gigantea]ESP00636.1 hypothetical protein LOTGIDRAFT_157917 [Lottia gigantea]